MGPRFAASVVDEGIVTPEPLYRQRLEGVSAYAATPVGLSSSGDSAVRSRHVPDCHILDSRAPDTDAVVPRILNMALLQDETINGTMDIKTVCPRVHRD